jgi:hypothetical protein
MLTAAIARSMSRMRGSLQSLRISLEDLAREMQLRAAATLARMVYEDLAADDCETSGNAQLPPAGIHRDRGALRLKQAQLN